MTDRQHRIEYMTKEGFIQGETYDWLNDEWVKNMVTIEERAGRAWRQMGYRTHKKQFIAGYIQGAEKTAAKRESLNLK